MKFEIVWASKRAPRPADKREAQMRTTTTLGPGLLAAISPNTANSYPAREGEKALHHSPAMKILQRNWSCALRWLPWRRGVTLRNGDHQRFSMRPCITVQGCHGSEMSPHRRCRLRRRRRSRGVRRKKLPTHAKLNPPPPTSPHPFCWPPVHLSRPMTCCNAPYTLHQSFRAGGGSDNGARGCGIISNQI